MYLAEFLLISMVIVLCCFLLTGYPVTFVIGGTAFLFFLIGLALQSADLFQMAPAVKIGMLNNRIIGRVIRNEVLLAVPMFVFMGIILERSKIAEDLLVSLGELFGSLRGGLGISVIIVGALLAATTGIVGATVVSMGVIALPTMLKKNYDSQLSTGIIAASGTLGQIIPPSIVLILLTDVVQNQYAEGRRLMENNWKTVHPGQFFIPDGQLPPLKVVTIESLFHAALVPGLLLVALYILYVILLAIFQPQKVPCTTAEYSIIPEKKTLIKRLSLILLFIIIFLICRNLPEQINLNNATYHVSTITLPVLLFFGLLLIFHFMEVSKVIQSLLPPLLLILAVLGSIFAGIASPTEAGSIGSVGAILLAGARIYAERHCHGRLNWTAMLPLFSATLAMLLLFSHQMNDSLKIITVMVLAIAVLISVIYLYKVDIMHKVNISTLHVSAMVFSILIAAQLLSLTFRAFKGEEIITQFIHSLPGGITTAILVVMLIVFLLGFILDFIEITYIIIPIIGPILFSMGVDPIWFAILFAINIQTSFLTPPFGFALFFLRGVAPSSVKTSDIYKGAIPFIVIQLVVLLSVFFWHDIATWLPDHLEAIKTARRLAPE